MTPQKKITLVLGGGGMKGLAHIGVLKVIQRLGIVPDEYVGTSVGALVAALAAGGMSAKEIEDIALRLQKKDILDFNWDGLLARRGQTASLYRGEALQRFVKKVIAVDSFDKLPHPLYVTTVNINTGREVLWGLPGHDDIPIHKCVAASCSIPGIFPPKAIRGEYYVDGSIADPLPLKIAYYHNTAVAIAVYLDSPRSISSGRIVQDEGAVSIITHAQSITSRKLVEHSVEECRNLPYVMVEPIVIYHGIFEFRHLQRVIVAGERAAEEAIANHPSNLQLLSPSSAG